jgi:hypothetical protein
MQCFEHPTTHCVSVCLRASICLNLSSIGLLLQSAKSSDSPPDLFAKVTMPGLSSVITQVQRPPTSSPTNARRVKPVGDSSDADVPSVPEEEDLDDVVISVPPKPRAGLSVVSAAEDERQETVVVESKPTGWRALLACLCGPSSETREISTKTSEESGGSSETTVARQRVNTQGTAYAQSASAPDSAPGFQIPVPPPYNGPSLLGPVHHADKGKKCLVLDLDETLVHSSFKVYSTLQLCSAFY